MDKDEQKVPLPKDQVSDRPTEPDKEHDMPAEKCKREIKINPYGMVILVLLAVTLAYWIPTYKLGNEIDSLQGSVELVMSENIALSKFKVTAEEVISKADLSIEVNEAVTDWAYKNAKNWIPRVTIVDIVRECSRYDNYYMLLSIIKEESNFYIYAKSEKDAKGLGQIQNKWWSEELITGGIWKEDLDVFDYRRHIKGMNYILEKLYKQTGSWEATLLKYVNGDPIYVQKVLSNYGRIRLIANGK